MNKLNVLNNRKDTNQTKINYEQIFNEAKKRLYSVFPNIPRELANQKVIIEYKWENWIWYKILLFSNLIIVRKIQKRNHSFTQVSKRFWKTISLNKESEQEYLDLTDFRWWMDNIINNKDKCEINISEKRYKLRNK